MRRATIPGLLLLLASCTALEMPAPDRDPEVLALRDANRKPLALAVGVAPLEMDLAGDPPAGLESFRVASDMVDILETAGVFKEVSLLVPGADPPPGTDLVLRLTFHRLETRYEGRNGWFVPNLLLWAALVFPAWWVPDETYSATVHLEGTVASVRSSRRLGSHTASVKVTRDLDDWQRGWLPLGILLAPGVFSDGNWRAVARETLGPGIRKAQIDLARWLAGDFRERVVSGEVSALSAVTHALCVGLSKYESLALHNLEAPRREARSLARFLADPDLGGVRPDQVGLLLDDEASLDRLRRRLEEILVKRPVSQDTVLVYLSGYGDVVRTDKGAVHALLAYDSTPGQSTGSLSVADLAGAASRSAAGRVVLVLDAGFTGGPRTRGAGEPPAFENELFGTLRDAVLPGCGMVVVVNRVGASGTRAFLPDFTAALAGKADLDENGEVTGAELKEVLTHPAPGAGYAVRVFGEDLKSLRIPFARGRSKP